MSSVHIEVEPTGSDGKVVIDGYDLAKSTRAFTIHSRVGHRTRLELELWAHDVTTFEAEHVQVRIDSTTAEYLERSGWLPPPGVASVLTRDADGCPCERVDVGWAEDNPDDQKTVLGRTVPTCPVHGVNRKDNQ